jgi:hypothetical protein
MTLLSRVSRFERRHTSGDPYPLEGLTDEELDEAINALNQHLADAIGSSGNGVVDIPVDMDEQQLRNIAWSFKGGQHG